jgi:glycosyltransferase involved in cell wall biosynthesis
MISFVVPCLNEELLIGRCIRSIQREIISTGIEAEIIVVDNGSTDNTASLASLHGADVVYWSKPGLLEAKQAGLKTVQYPLVAFIDADCMLRVGWLTKVIERFADPKVEAASGPYHYYDLPWHGQVASDVVFGVYSVMSYFIPVMMGGNSVFRTDTLRRLGGFDVSIPFWGEDTWSVVQMAKQGKVVWDAKLKVDSSGRRLIGQGYLTTLWSYLVNSVAVRLTGKPTEQIHKQYR